MDPAYRCLLTTLLAALFLALGESFSDLRVADRGNAAEEVNWVSSVRYLPGVFEFARGVDYTNGKRSSLPIFKFTYEQSMSGNPEYLYDDNLQGITYRIPDQIAASNWASECSRTGDLESSKSSSVTEYLKARGHSRGSGFEFSVDVSIKVPIAAITEPIKTKIGAALGYAKSRGSAEYYKRMRSGETEVIHVESTAAMWTVAWRRYHTKTLQRMPSPSEFSIDFAMSVRSLASTCFKNGPDAEGRIKRGKKTLSRTACDIEAAALVADFGTHYNKQARFGGKSYTNFYYNVETASSVQASYSQAYSEHKFSLLFFKRSRSSAKMERKFDEEHMSEVVIRGEMFVLGGDSSFGSPAEWCKSVRYQPTIIRNTKLVPIADLIEDDRGRFAVMMAIMDAWVCNGGTAVNFDMSTGTVECSCPDSEEYCLDERCRPSSSECFDESVKLLVGFTKSYTNIFKSTKSASYDGSFYRPDPPAGYEIVGSVAVKGYQNPTNEVIVIHSSTSTAVAKAADRFVCILRDRPADGFFLFLSVPHDVSIWRPVCPSGYSSVSDFVQDYWDWPGSYKGELIRPCIIDHCLQDCQPIWVWDDTCFVCGGPLRRNPIYTLFRVAGGKSKYGSDVGYEGGFFRATQGSKTPSDKALFRCIKPECVHEN